MGEGASSKIQFGRKRKLKYIMGPTSIRMYCVCDLFSAFSWCIPRRCNFLRRAVHRQEEKRIKQLHVLESIERISRWSSTRQYFETSETSLELNPFLFDWISCLIYRTSFRHTLLPSSIYRSLVLYFMFWVWFYFSGTVPLNIIVKFFCWYRGISNCNL